MTQPQPFQFGPPRIVVNTASEISPQAFEGLAQQLEQRGIKTPISQVVGYQQLTPHNIGASGGGSILANTSSAVFSDADPISLALGGLRPGSYQITFSARVKVNAVANTGVLGVQINGVDPGGATAGTTDHFLFNNSEQTTCSTTFYVTLKGDTSVLKMRWLVTGGTASIYEYILFALKIGN